MGKQSSIVCLHILTVSMFLDLFLIQHLNITLLQQNILNLLIIVMMIASETIVRGLKEEKYWGWVSGIIFFGINIVLHRQGFMIMVPIIGMIGLLMKDTRDIYRRVSK